MDHLKHSIVESNDISVHCVELGEGPLVLMCHGFPESWYSWRHQLNALAAAGFRAVAMDMRGYGGSSKPIRTRAYDQVTIAADVAGVIEAYGENQAVLIGHDWGAPAVWHTALLHPDKVKAVVGLSVPYTGRGPEPPIAMMKQAFLDNFFYILYFQTPGIAEAELESDIRDFLLKFVFHASADGDFGLFSNKSRDAKLLDGLDAPAQLPDWLTQQDLDFYVAEFEKNGFSCPLNWYRSLDETWEKTAQLAAANITQPALFIAGKKDGVIGDGSSLEIMKTRMDQLNDVVLLDDCGHWTQQEKPLEVNNAIIKFLNYLK